jgi:hypothetical protein
MPTMIVIKSRNDPPLLPQIHENGKTLAEMGSPGFRTWELPTASGPVDREAGGFHPSISARAASNLARRGVAVSARLRCRNS